MCRLVVAIDLVPMQLQLLGLYVWLEPLTTSEAKSLTL